MLNKMKILQAVLIDAISIQQYIFSSNKLTINIGASHIIEHWLYRDLIPNSLNELSLPFPKTPDGSMSIDTKTIHLLQPGNTDKAEAGYIGGGNALLLFADLKDATNFINLYSLRVLEYFPGLTLAFGRAEFDSSIAYSSFRKTIHDDLKNNKSCHNGTSHPFKPGLTEDCPYSNDTASVQYNDQWISGTVKAKFDAAEESKRMLNSKPGTTNPPFESFCFTNDQDKLGQDETKSYIAIVTADGNGIGQLFNSKESLLDIRNLSTHIANLASGVLIALTNHVCSIATKDDSDQYIIADLIKLKKEGNNAILPIRPLITGGDDITFVCEGRLGIYLAKTLIELLRTQKSLSNENEIFEACCGIMIVHTKFPFYQAYKLSKELLTKAKQKSREDQNASYLYFLMSSGGITGQLDEILHSKYKVGHDKFLKYGPYKIADNSNFSDLLSIVKQFSLTTEEGGWPKNKLMDLRSTLQKEKSSRELFKKHLDMRAIKMPDKHKKLWQNNKTMLFDAIELIDFYPTKLIN
jgi:hypothetical protein